MTSLDTPKSVVVLFDTLWTHVRNFQQNADTFCPGNRQPRNAVAEPTVRFFPQAKSRGPKEKK